MSVRLKRLRLTNYRCFGECEVTFHSELTVLVADNGRGKTAIMDAVATALTQMTYELSGVNRAAPILLADVRMASDGHKALTPRTPTVIEVNASIDGTDLDWRCERKEYAAYPKRSKLNIWGLTAACLKWLSRWSAQEAARDSLVLPITAYYTSNRFAAPSDPNRRVSSHLGLKRVPPGSYPDVMPPEFDSKKFEAWYEQQVTAIRAHAPARMMRLEPYLDQLTAVRMAVDDALRPTGWGTIDWDAEQKCVVVEHPDQGRLPLGMLSSGVRNMVALTADLAHRCARLNFRLGKDAARLTPGVVLIDEVDLHLHPAWQQQVVGLLRRAFPAMQFILSTHSPQVLSTVKAESIRVIKSADGVGQIVTPKFQTCGVESADVLATIMEVDPIPQVLEAEMLSRYRALVEDGTHDGDDGRDLRQKLVAHFGDEHPLILDCDRLIRFSQFKRRAAVGA